MFPWNVNIITNVAKSPTIVTGSKIGRNVREKYSFPFRFITVYLVNTPPTNGTATKAITEPKRISQGTKIFVAFNSNETIGTNRIMISKSFIET